MIEWWEGLSGKWSWTDPVLLLGFVTVLVTALIPVVLWWFGAKQAKRDSALNEHRTKTLDRQEQIFRRQRRDSLLEIVDRSSDATHLGLLWREVGEYEGKDRDLLLSVFRTNVTLALPGTSNGVTVDDSLTDTVVAHYVSGLERRYAVGTDRYVSYPGLLDFLVTAKSRRAKIQASKIVALVTGATSEYQRPSHGFYRDLANVLPESAGELLNAVGNIDYHHAGGLRLNVLTGTLLALKDVQLERFQGRQSMRPEEIQALRYSASVSLATLLHRDNLRSFDRWSREGSTEPVSATVAWLIIAVGWLADVDNHLAMRMIQNLADAIESVPAADRSWGIDAEDVRQGFESIMRKQPALWESYGEALEVAATSVGAWKAKAGKD